jgi:transcriptional regulator with XRE-family HTH domain
MLLVRITGAQIRAGRALAGLTIEDLAARAQLHRQSVRKWEGSSNSVPDAMVAHLSRAVDVLEDAGVRFTDNGGGSSPIYVCSPPGSRTANTEPFPGSLVTVTSPPIMRASLRVMARPRPVPPKR